MIKVSIEPPKERIVTIQMTEGEAKILKGFFGRLNEVTIEKIGGDYYNSSEEIFDISTDVYRGLEENL